MEAIRPNHPLRRLFAGLVEDAFCTGVGLCDPRLTDYLSDLLVSFTHIDRLNAIRNAQDKRLDQIAAMLAIQSDEPATTSELDRRVYRNIGDYTLFWAGVYPEQLRRPHLKREDVLVDYVAQGRRSYAIVADLVKEDGIPPASLFRHLSEEFEFCLYGLGLVRLGWEQSEQSVGDVGGELLF